MCYLGNFSSAFKNLFIFIIKHVKQLVGYNSVKYSDFFYLLALLSIKKLLQITPLVNNLVLIFTLFI